MRTPLDKELRRELESAIVKARDIAESAAAEELKRLSVPVKTPAEYLSDGKRALRNRLRAHGRVLGDLRRADGEQDIGLLVSEVAYQLWHRMLFARFLAENDLLIYEDGVTPLSIHDCFELAEEETGDRTQGWQYAARYAAAMLPQIFRLDSPVFELSLAPNDQKQLEQLLDSLDPSTFTASDSLGWAYQFWQSKRKDEVNASEVKIGAKELSPVTQLFTEPYMVSFLLDNNLGAWWANQQLTEADYFNAQSEDELRKRAAIDGVPLEHLRFVRTYTPAQQAVLDSDEPPEEKLEPGGPWEPAAGNFEQWPTDLSELKALDPCCGSGHFLVAVFLMLVPLRMQREDLTEKLAVDAVLRQNIFGLELDQRCVEIAAFALALEAWRYPNAGGYRPLPELHLACSGLSVKAAREEWKQLGLGKKNLTIALDWMHKHFSDAPVLGSLINPAKSDASKIVPWEELSETLNTALKKESDADHGSEEGQRDLEAVVVAHGMARAAAMLADKYHWVVTNVPYLGRGRQSSALQKYIEAHYPLAKGDLATVFLQRSLDFCLDGGYSSSVLPQNWLFLSSYEGFRKKLLKTTSWNILARLGPGAFDTISGEVVQAILFTVRKTIKVDSIVSPQSCSDEQRKFSGIEVSDSKNAAAKAEGLKSYPIFRVSQPAQLLNPQSSIMFEPIGETQLLSSQGPGVQGIATGDNARFRRNFWEVLDFVRWSQFQTPPDHSNGYSGLDCVVDWSHGTSELASYTGARIQGKAAWNHVGVAINRVSLNAAIYMGTLFDDATNVIPLADESGLGAVWAYVSSTVYPENVRRINQKTSVSNTALVSVPFDQEYWSKSASHYYPRGLPKPYSNNPTQWIFHGHPSGSVLWNDAENCLEISSSITSEYVLQVAVARLLGYQWPAEVDGNMQLAVEQRSQIAKSESLQSHVDDDGIVCLPAVRGEKSANHRLEQLLQSAFGEWNSKTRDELLDAVHCTGKNIEFWLRDKFFEQHCKLFQNRPFIWQIWDGLPDGFSVLVNYHLLDRKNLERLIYTYLDDWIRSQKHEQSEGVDGAGVRLSAAEVLKLRLEQILAGEAPYDVFVRWKLLDKQSLGWNPDLNDGVRLNIRPFMSVDDVGKKGAGILRAKPNIHWKKDRGKDVELAPWYKLGLEYGGKEGDRINDHHLTLGEKRAAAKD